MATTIDQLLDQYERGGLSRRQLVKGLMLLTVPSAALAQANAPAARATSTPVAPTRSFNHLAFDVSDMEKSIEFYKTVLGATERGRSGPNQVTMRLPHSTKTVGAFISLSKRERGAPGTFNHVGLGVDWSKERSPQWVADEVRKRYPQNKPPLLLKESTVGGRRVEMFVYDPDGLPLQLLGVDDDGWLCPGVTPGSCA